ncbi:hypothetical protein BGX34_002388 [Mortierella sp. NVP85]|nr:hypothetical protein BGX34_002388 [Mortierella sp. NVP85]
MDLNWCPVCEQHIPLAWESSLYCSDRCKKADAMATHPALGYEYPADLQSFPRQKNSPTSSPTLTGFSPAATSNYPSPPTSPMTSYAYNKTTASGRISPPAFSLGHAAGPQYSTATTTVNKKGGFFW